MKTVFVTVLTVYCILSSPALSQHKEYFDATAFLRSHLQNSFQERNAEYIQICQEIFQPQMNACYERLNQNILTCKSDHDNAAVTINEELRPAKEENDKQSILIQDSLTNCGSIEDYLEYFNCNVQASNANALRAITMGGNCKSSADLILRKTENISKDYQSCNDKAVKQSQYEINSIHIYIEWTICNINGPTITTTTTPTTTTEAPSN